jgi:hypothetical protein
MKFELASLLSLLLVASSVNAGHRKHNKGGPQPSVETGETPTHDEAPPKAVDPSTIKGPQRILKNPGIVRCWLDDYNQTLAILDPANTTMTAHPQVQSSQATPHPHITKPRQPSTPHPSNPNNASSKTQESSAAGSTSTTRRSPSWK